MHYSDAVEAHGYMATWLQDQPVALLQSIVLPSLLTQVLCDVMTPTIRMWVWLDDHFSDTLDLLW